MTLAYLGVSAVGNGSRHGVPVQVEPGGPANNAGLKDRDKIESIDGRGVSYRSTRCRRSSPPAGPGMRSACVSAAATTP